MIDSAAPELRAVDAPVEEAEAVDLLLRLLAVEGITGDEERIGLEIVAALSELGVPAEVMRFDDAHKRIPLPTSSGNLVVDLPGDPALPRRLFMAHRDTVALCAGARPERVGKRIVSSAPTALGGDDRAGVACLIHMVGMLRRHRLSHPPLTLLFTVREESGMWGARHVDAGALGRPALAFNLDGASPAELTIGALGGTRWAAEIRGQAAHAGLHPERGISATLVAAHALAAMHRRGWWGRIRRSSGEGTANVGRLAGRDGGVVGDATNVVTEHVTIEGEARSHAPKFIPRIVAAHRRALTAAAAKVRNDRGETAEIAFRSETMYEPFRLDAGSDLVRFALERGRAIGLDPSLRIADGGLDANWMFRRGIPTLTFGVGQREVHTVDEYVDVAEFLAACRLTVALARA